jgi:hypothetical protein
MCSDCDVFEAVYVLRDVFEAVTCVQGCDMCSRVWYMCSDCDVCSREWYRLFEAVIGGQGCDMCSRK